MLGVYMALKASSRLRTATQLLNIVYGTVDGEYFDLIDITERVDEAFEELLPS